MQMTPKSRSRYPSTAAEMAARDMTAVLVLNNFFQWSGGMAQYVSWATGTPSSTPSCQSSGRALRSW